MAIRRMSEATQSFIDGKNRVMRCNDNIAIECNVSGTPFPNGRMRLALMAIYSKLCLGALLHHNWKRYVNLLAPNPC